VFIHGILPAMTDLERRQLDFLKYSHLVAGIIHIGSSAFLLGYTADGNTWTPALELPRDVWTEITTGECNDTFTGRCFRQERSYETYGIDLAALCAVFAFWSGFLHLLVFSPFYQKYKETILQKFGFWRWLDYTISASIMIVVIAIYCGITDTFLLASLGLLEATVILLGAGSEWALSKWVSNTEADGKKNPDLQKLSKYLLVLAFLLFALMWVPILSTFFLSISSAENVPSVVYIVVFTYPLSFLFFGLVSLQIYRKNMENYLWYEFNFILLSLVSKVLLHWSIFFALLMRGEQLENDQFERNSPGTVDENSLYGVIGGVLACGVVTALVASRYWPKDTNAVAGGVMSKARVVQMYTFW
jgi:hypothetical protein